jgi:DNA-binding PadR family transcriptional regulator
MSSVKQLFEKVEQVAANRPSYSLQHFLPRQVLELGVLGSLETGDLSGDLIIRELALLSRYASGYGVNYPLLHQMEADGHIEAYQANSSPRRIYRITEAGRNQLQKLGQLYSTASAEEYQTGLTLIYGSTMVNNGDVTAYAN